MTSELKKNIESISNIYPEHFKNKRVLQIGGNLENQQLEYLFNNCKYVVVDDGKDLNINDEIFDVIILSQYSNYDMEVYQTFQKIIRLLRAGGLFIFSSNHDSPEKRSKKMIQKSLKYKDYFGYPNYYKTFSFSDIIKIIDINKFFNYVCVTQDKQFLDFYCIRNDNNNYAEMNELDMIMRNNDTDKSSIYHNYPRQYNDYFHRFKFKNIKLLEIGVFRGGSLKSWREFLPNATHIVGVDILDWCKDYQNISNGMYVEIGNVTNKEFIEYIYNKYGSFDVIIDDGSHKNDHVIKAFESLFPLMNDNGLYIVEDTNVYTSDEHINKSYPNHIDYFTQFLPYLNQGRNNILEGIKDSCADPFKSIKKTDSVFEYSIDKIDFGCSFIAIHKLLRKHWMP